MTNETIDYKDALGTPIPQGAGDVSNWQMVPIRESGEKMVAIGAFTPEEDEYREIPTSSIYAGERKDSPYFANPLDHSVIGMFLRKSAADVVVKAQELAPKGVYLLLRDCWRDLRLQKALYDFYLNQLQRLHPDWEEDQLAKHTRDYVSFPSYDNTKPSPHNTGGAIDLELIKVPLVVDKRIKTIDQRLCQLTDGSDQNQIAEAYHLEMEKLGYWNEQAFSLDFGTPFDYGKDEAWLRWFETIERPLSQREQVQRGNRRLLYWLMREAGAQAFASEWWHYNVGNQMAAKAGQKLYASYGMTELSSENASYEDMRKSHSTRNIALHGKPKPVGGQKLGYSQSFLFNLSFEEAQKRNYVLTNLKHAAIISPTNS